VSAFARWLARAIPLDAADAKAVGQVAIVAVLATGVVAWAATMVVLVRLIVGV